MTQSTVLQGLSLLEQLGWSEARGALLRGDHKLLDRSLPGLLPGASGGRRRPSAPSRPRQVKGRPPFRGTSGVSRSSHWASSIGSAAGQRKR